MTTTKDDKTSHIDSVTETCVWFFNNSGACGWPTVLSIMFNTCIQPDALKWVEKSGLKFPKPPAIGDAVHWYKTKFDNVSNFRRSVPFLLKGVSYFNQKNIPEVINGCKKAFMTKNAVYFISSSGSVKVCRLTETDVDSNAKDIELTTGPDIGDVLDAVSYNNYDYLLTKDYIYRFDSSQATSGGKFDLFFTAPSQMNAFGIIGDIIIVATSDGGLRLSNLTSSSPSSKNIRRQELTYTAPAEDSGSGSGSSGGEQQTTSEQYDNGVPQRECKFVYVEGSSYYIGDDSTSGFFQSSDTSFTPVYGEKENHVKVLSSKPNKNCLNNTFVESKGKLLYKGIEYSLTGVNTITETDGYVFFGTDSGIKVYSSSQIEGKFGPTEEYANLAGVSGSVKNIIDLYGNIFTIGDGKYRTFDAFDEDIEILQNDKITSAEAQDVVSIVKKMYSQFRDITREYNANKYFVAIAENREKCSFIWDNYFDEEEEIYSEVNDNEIE